MKKVILLSGLFICFFTNNLFGQEKRNVIGGAIFTNPGLRITTNGQNTRGDSFVDGEIYYQRYGKNFKGRMEVFYSVTTDSKQKAMFIYDYLINLKNTDFAIFLGGGIGATNLKNANVIFCVNAGIEYKLNSPIVIKAEVRPESYIGNYSYSNTAIGIGVGYRF
ncbi:MAG: hypothetical protein H6604_03915 [Flavobacteriales bacterium]|nr:hypothetical protein [Flavobacteriales bacterium]